MLSRDAETGRLIVDREWGRALERLAAVDPAAAGQAAFSAAKRSGAFTHLDGPSIPAVRPMPSRDAETGRLIVDHEWGRALEQLAAVDPAAAGQAAYFAARRSGAFTHLDGLSVTAVRSAFAHLATGRRPASGG
jgi:hypothetical protein